MGLQNIIGILKGCYQSSTIIKLEIRELDEKLW